MGQIENELLKVREKLLDLSLRNQLLNFQLYNSPYWTWLEILDTKDRN